jgi:hypothetical protein
MPGARLLTALMVVLGAAPPVAATPALFRLGSFVKPRGGPVVQSGLPHGLGETPRAMIFWTAGSIAQGVGTEEGRLVLGATAGPGAEGSAALAAQNRVNPTNVSRRMATAAITVAWWGEAVSAEARLVSWNAATFSLAWTVNDDNPMIIHYLAVGGTDVQAQVVAWQAPAGPGDRTVTVGFAPEVILNFHAGADLVAAPPRSQRHGLLGMGVQTRHGDQWAISVASEDGLALDASNLSNTARWQVTDACLSAFDVRRAPTKVATCTLTSTGFVAHFSQANLEASQLFTLALAGVSARAGTFAKTPAPAVAVQSIGGIGFAPDLVLLSSDLHVTSSSIDSDNRWAMGAATRSPLRYLCAGVADDQGSNMFSNSDQWTKDDKVLVKIDNPMAIIDAEATLSAFTPDGFELSWQTNDTEDTQISYLALAAAPPPPDAGADAPPDAAPVDAGPEVGVDAAADAAGDSAIDAGIDVAIEPDSEVDRPVEAAEPDGSSGSDPGSAPAAASDGGSPGASDGSGKPSSRDIVLRVGCACIAAGGAGREHGAWLVAAWLLPVPLLIRRRFTRR